MGETHKSHAKGYIIIFFILGLLTVLELIIPSMTQMAYSMRASSLVLLAIAKAFIVAYYYMHLNEEKAWLKFIAAIPIMAVFYATFNILEALYR